MTLIILILVAFVLAATIILVPMSIAYLFIAYAFLNGLASREFMAEMKVSFGSTNIFLMDLLLAAGYLAVALIPFRRARDLPVNSSAVRQRRIVVLLALSLLLFRFAQAAFAYFSGVPLEAMIRMFVPDIQFLFVLIPIFYLRNRDQLKSLLSFVVVLCLIFPFGQLSLGMTEDTLRIMKGQGTLRLGYGDFNLVLALGFLTFIVWRERIYLAVFPALGILLLAHRSAFIGILLSSLVVGMLRGSGLKTAFLFVALSISLGAAGFLAQYLTGYSIMSHSLSRVSETVEATGTTTGRLSAIKTTLENLSSYPFFGIGYDGLYALRDRVNYDARAFNLIHPHNFVMSSLTLSGIVGTLLLLGIITYFMNAAARLAAIPATQKEGAFLFSGMLFFLLFSAMNTTFGLSHIFWILGGISIWFLIKPELLNDADFEARDVEKDIKHDKRYVSEI